MKWGNFDFHMFSDDKTLILSQVSIDTEEWDEVAMVRDWTLTDALESELDQLSLLYKEKGYLEIIETTVGDKMKLIIKSSTRKYEFNCDKIEKETETFKNIDLEVRISSKDCELESVYSENDDLKRRLDQLILLVNKELTTLNGRILQDNTTTSYLAADAVYCFDVIMRIKTKLEKSYKPIAKSRHKLTQLYL